MTQPLSPAAQAVRQAFDARYELCGPFDDNWQELCLAAALRALADQVVPEEQATPWGSTVQAAEPLLHVRRNLLAIAAELEATNS